MDEKKHFIELFYLAAVSTIREKQVSYLRKTKAQPFLQDIPDIDELSPGDYAKLRWWQKIAYKWTLRKQRKARRKALRAQKRPVDDDLTRGYNSGIELALDALARKHAEFLRELGKLDN